MDGTDIFLISIGAVIFILIIVLLTFVVLVIRNRRFDRLSKADDRKPIDKDLTTEVNNNKPIKNNNQNNNNIASNDTSGSNTNQPIDPSHAEPTKTPNNSSTTKRSNRNCMACRPTEIRLPCIRTLRDEYNNIGKTEIQKSEVLERVKQIRNDDFDWIDREFEVLNRGFPTERKSVIQSVDNMKKNRFMDVLPYDDNRVKIENHHSDYINASFIDGYDVKRNFIATQGPIGHNETNQGKRESTLEDFWMMLWEQSVQCVVMLTECVENLRLKCAQYWPDEVGAECHYGKVSVRLTRSYCCDDICTLREMRVSYEGNTRMVTQWHYKEWQDCKGPQDARHLIKFIRRVRQSEPQAPILVHCSAGVGRTGVFIALDILLQHIQHHSSVDIFECVKKLREQRVRMVQTIEQYSTLYETVAIAIQESENSPADSTTSERSSIEDRYDYMNTTSTSNTLTQIVINA